ncbi:MAG: right-handed parallel beta-helix repeat-containing protein [Clostridia bacterium]|nr:right-handed parallel beta-helix repeat-containing protein [Clostridia bacterium]
MENFLLILLSLSVCGSALGLLVLLLSKVGKKRVSSAFIYLCWALVILRFVLPVSGLVGISFTKTAPESILYTVRGDGNGGLYVSPLVRTEGMLTREDARKNTAASEIISEANVPAAETGRAADAAGNASSVPLYRNPALWFYMWLSGALVSFIGTLISFGHFRHLLFRTLKPARPLDSSVLAALNASPYPALYRSDRISTTLLLGLIRPVIVLPDREYTSEDLDRILRHELTHYRRGDLALKWLQTLAYSIHWFNPLVYLFRTQTTLYCELSCDQNLLRRMDRNDKRSYGELLLNLAADRALPRRVIAVSFTTQKRDLKERLVQIMTFKKLGKQALALSLAVLMMIAGCAFVLGPARASSGADTGNTDTAQTEYETVRVSSADEFIKAIGSNRTILLAPGTYDLSAAAAYGRTQGEEYYWEQIDDGYTLVLDVVRNLTIAGEGGAEQVSIITEPRSADVLKLLGANNVTIKGVTCGHTQLPDACQGAVINLYGCCGVSIQDSVLYGCGTIGVLANECWKLRCENTVIKECSTGALDIANSYDVVFDKCEFHDCEAHDGYAGPYLVESYNNTLFGIYNTLIYNNHVDCFVESSNTHVLELAGCRVYDNRFETGFAVSGDNVSVEYCEFRNNGLKARAWFDRDCENVFDLDGEPLDAAALESMQWAEFTETEWALPETEKPEGKLLDDGTTEYHVNTSDELLACLGSDRVIYLEGDDYELSSAYAYGGDGSSSYYWMQCFDGYELVLIGIDNMKIVASNGKANVEIVPRSANVMAFKYCSGVTLDGLVLGHVGGLGNCMGDVISFMGCDRCTLNNCGLYGCGVNGVNAFGSVDIHVNDSEIYECSGYAAVISDCEGTEFNNVTIRDCGFNSIETQRCRVRFSGSTYYSPDYVPKTDYDYYGYGEDEYYGEPAPEEAMTPFFSWLMGQQVPVTDSEDTAEND